MVATVVVTGVTHVRAIGARDICSMSACNGAKRSKLAGPTSRLPQKSVGGAPGPMDSAVPSPDQIFAAWVNVPVSLRRRFNHPAHRRMLPALIGRVAIFRTGHS